MTENHQHPGRDQDTGDSHAYPRIRSHYLPRTKRGWVAVLLFLGLFAFTQPPLVYLVANRIEPTIVGLPFLYVYLLLIYIVLIVVLIWAQRYRV